MFTSKSRIRSRRRGKRRLLSIEQLERLRYLELLPDDAAIRTPDAALFVGCGLSSWERRRQLGQTPPGFWLNGSALAYLKGQLVKHRAEFATKLKTAPDGETPRQYPAVPIDVAMRRKRDERGERAEVIAA